MNQDRPDSSKNLISFYICTDILSPGLVKAVKNVYRFVDEIIILSSKPFSSQNPLKRIDPDGKFRLFQAPFKHFAQFRNLALSKARYSWILWLDTDETFSRYFLIRVKKYINTEKYDGYKIHRMHFYRTHHQAQDPFDHLRLFRNKKGAHYIGAVHELLNGIEHISHIKSWESAILHHNNYLDMKRKNASYRIILEKEYEQAIISGDKQLVELANFRLWCNSMIDNPEFFGRTKKTRVIKKAFNRKLKKILKNKEHYHRELLRLEHLYSNRSS